MDLSKPPKVTDPDILERLRLVEGKDFCRDQDGNDEPVMSATHEMPVVKFLLQWRSAHGDSVITVFTSAIIYGAGSWNRYFVRSDGALFYSRRHGRNEPKAVAAGFPIR